MAAPLSYVIDLVGAEGCLGLHNTCALLLPVGDSAAQISIVTGMQPIVADEMPNVTSLIQCQSRIK